MSQPKLHMFFKKKKKQKVEILESDDEKQAEIEEQMKTLYYNNLYFNMT